MRTSLLAIILLACLAIPVVGFARIGVGIGTGKIQIDEPLKAGGVYELPPLVVINTGDEPSFYGVNVEYHANIPELRPDRDWFQFTPSTFDLAPGQAQKVAIQLTLPVQTTPADYFAYLEAHPVYTQEGEGGAQIGIAAAAKLNFTVAPANIFQGMYYRLLHFWNAWAPWPLVAVLILAGAVILLIARKFVSLNIGFRKPARQPLPREEEEIDEDEDDYEEVVIRRPRKKTTKTAAKKTSRKRKE